MINYIGKVFFHNLLLHDFVEMATRTPASDRALDFARKLRTFFNKNGIRALVNTHNGNRISVSWLVKAQTAYKLTLKFLAIDTGYIEGQIQINEKAGGKNYWDMQSALASAGFRYSITKSTNNGIPARESFLLELVGEDNQLVFDENGNQKYKRIDIIKIKTAPLANPSKKFQVLFNLIIDFEQIERNPISAHEPSKLSATAWVPRDVPPPTSAEWVPQPSKASSPTTSWANKMADEDDDVKIVRLRETLAKLEAKKMQKNAEAERKKKLEEFKAQQAVALAEFEKSLAQ